MSKEFINLGKYKEYLTGEERALSAKYADPLTLNFKLLIDFDSSFGLFATKNSKGELPVNSALGFLKRIGQNERYEMLKNWIAIFQIFVKEYDFLILEAIGLDTIQNAKAFEQFIEEEDSIEIKIRETSDMLIHGLLTTYRHIWFDNIRGVEILPINLRRFDLNILVFSSGYYNMLYYDNNGIKSDESTPTNIEKLLYPTLRKLNDTTFNNKSSESYNHVLFQLQGCSINNEESGKSFIETVSNEPGGDFVKNNMVFNFQFAQHKGRFNNIIGDVDFVALLAIMSAQNKAITSENQGKLSLKDKLKEQLKSPVNNIKKSFSKENINKQASELKQNTINTLNTKAENQINKLTSKNSVVGNLLSKMTPDFASQMIKNTFDVGINFIEKKAIDEPISRLNNMLFQNYSNNLLDIYKNYFQDKKNNSNIKLLENQKISANVNKTIYSPEGIKENKGGIKFGVGNVYKRTGF